MSELLEQPEVIDNIPSERCPDYDQDCALVKNHFSCWTGGTFYHEWATVELKPVNGYCPFVFGMINN